MKVTKTVKEHSISEKHICGYVKVYFPKNWIGEIVDIEIKTVGKFSNGFA